MTTFQPSRSHALACMKNFVPLMGQSYTSKRNYDLGTGNHNFVSQLSPYVRRRLITEQEVVQAASQAHGLEGAEKFIQEVFWRSYFKGWLERRPGIWNSYVQGVHEDLEEVNSDPNMEARLARAESGETGITCFDAWANELTETGYLHNHSRMWFASIWVFTLHLPWRLGADFFYRHLLDGDPASNTLGWRWVAGLHTRRKPYEAKAWNIAKFTNNKFTPPEGEIASDIQSLDALEPEGLPALQPLRKPSVPNRELPSALLITEEDCHVETFLPEMLNICSSRSLVSSLLRSPRPVADHVRLFEAKALSDTASRLKVDATQMECLDPMILASWAKEAGAKQIVTAYVPEGPLRDWLRKAEPALQEAQIPLCEWQRDWDANIWPSATAGFFKVKQKIPSILSSLEIF